MQMLLPFLIALLPLLSARRDGLFLVSVLEEVLRLYLTVHQERCVDGGRWKCCVEGNHALLPDCDATRTERAGICASRECRSDA